MTGRGDKFANPTNTYMREQHDIIAASGKRSARCPGCMEYRWFNVETLRLPDPLCDRCVIDGRPMHAEPLPPTGGLCARQRAKKGKASS